MESLDRTDISADDRFGRRNTGASGLSVDVDSAGAALGDATAEFRSGQLKLVAKDPEKGHSFRDFKLVRFTVDLEFHSRDPSRGAGGVRRK